RSQNGKQHDDEDPGGAMPPVEIGPLHHQVEDAADPDDHDRDTKQPSQLSTPEADRERSYDQLRGPDVRHSASFPLAAPSRRILSRPRPRGKRALRRPSAP